MNLGKLLRVLASPALFRYYVQRRIRRVETRAWLADRDARKVGEKRFMGPSAVSADRLEPLSRQLVDEGYALLGSVLSPEAVEGVKRGLAGLECFDAYDRASTRSFPLEQVPPGTNTASYRWQDVVRIPDLVRVANDPGILTLVQRFLGGVPTISDIKMWWSLVRPGADKENQLFHRDRDEFRFCKLFVYLTDVDLEGGPHVYIPKSAESAKCTRDQRYSDEEAVEAFGKGSPVTLCAPAGHAFLVNTYGIHKGLVPTRRERLIFVAQYSLRPIGLIRYEPIDAAVPGSGLDAYVNRLFLRIPTGTPAGN